MNYIKVTRHEEVELAHILPCYDGPCGNLHGHTYKIEVTLCGPQDPTNFDMVMDFKLLKQIIKEVVPDHSFLYNNVNPSDVEKDIVDVLQKYNLSVTGMPFKTTAENMVGYYADKIQEKINKLGYPQIKVYKVKLYETTNSYAMWTLEEE